MAIQPCFSDLLDVYISLVIQNQDAISIVCMNELIKLVAVVGHQLAKEDWNLLLNQVTHLINSCAPKEVH